MRLLTRAASLADRSAAASCPVPPLGTWRVDAAQSSVAFVSKHLLGAITGRVPGVTGVLVVDPDVSSVDIEIDVSGADFGSELWNGVVRSHDLLGTREHPVARYASRRVRPEGSTAHVEGVLELHGHRGDVPLVVHHLPDPDVAPDLAPTVRFSGSAVLDRRAYGLRWDLAVVGGDRLIARDVRLEIDLLAHRV